MGSWHLWALAPGGGTWCPECATLGLWLLAPGTCPDVGLHHTDSEHSTNGQVVPALALRDKGLLGDSMARAAPWPRVTTSSAQSVGTSVSAVLPAAQSHVDTITHPWQSLETSHWKTGLILRVTGFLLQRPLVVSPRMRSSLLMDDNLVLPVILLESAAFHTSVEPLYLILLN